MKSASMTATGTPLLLCVTDFSDSSIQAIHWAIPEAQKHHLHISVLYPYRLDQVKKKENGIQSKKELEEEAAQKFERLNESLLRNSHVPYDFRAEIGFIRDRIAEHARKTNVVMVVIGKKLASAESFQELIDEIRVPLVIIPSRNNK